MKIRTIFTNWKRLEAGFSFNKEPKRAENTPG